MGGKACVRGMRVTVSMVVSQIAAGRSIEEVLADYPYQTFCKHCAMQLGSPKGAKLHTPAHKGTLLPIDL